MLARSAFPCRGGVLRPLILHLLVLDVVPEEAGGGTGEQPVVASVAARWSNR